MSVPPRRRGASLRRSTRFALRCEHLESRQLLSVGQAGLAAGAMVSPAAVPAQIAVAPVFFNFTTASFSAIDIEIGTLSGGTQIQIVFSDGVFSLSSGGGSIFSPTPTSPSSGSGFGLGNSNGNTGTSGSGIVLISSTGSNSSSSITPLNPNSTSSTHTPGIPVPLVPPPLPPLVVHLGPSTAPATSQSNSTLLSLVQEQPTSITHFGQGVEFERSRLFMETKVAVEAPTSSLIDFVEPFQPVAPAGAPQGDTAPAPDAAKIQPMPAISDSNMAAALDLTDGRLLTRSRDGAASQPDDRLNETNTACSLSALFGAAAVVTGGYHLAMREADRFQGRWVPRWVGAERPTKRKAGLPAR